MNVFVTGATGFVGTYVLKRLLDNDHDVRVLVRPGSEPKLGAAADLVEIVRGDVTQPDTLVGQLDGCDAVIHLVGILLREDAKRGVTFQRIHLEGARNVIDVGYGRREILQAVRHELSDDFRQSLSDLTNPYGDGGAAERIIDKLKSIELNQPLLQKRFCDL